MTSIPTALFRSGLLACALLWPLHSVAAAGDTKPEQTRTDRTFRLSVDRTPPSAENAPRTVALGTATINRTLKLPAYALEVVHAGEDDSWLKERPDSLALDAKIDAKQAANLALWYTHNGWFLVPRGWRPLSGGVGANGTAALLFVAPQGEGYLAYYNASACVGCAQVAASAFFSEARKDAQDNDFPWYERTDPPLQITRLRPHLVAYRAMQKSQQINGIAYYDAAQDLPFYKLEVGLPPAQSTLATTLLNWRLPPR